MKKIGFQLTDAVGLILGVERKGSHLNTIRAPFHTRNDTLFSCQNNEINANITSNVCCCLWKAPPDLPLYETCWDFWNNIHGKWVHNVNQPWRNSRPANLDFSSDQSWEDLSATREWSRVSCRLNRWNKLDYDINCNINGCNTVFFSPTSKLSTIMTLNQSFKTTYYFCWLKIRRLFSVWPFS